MLLDISIIIPTKNRQSVLQATLDSIAQQNVQPREIIIIDASDYFNDDAYHNINQLESILHCKAVKPGAAKQRNQGIALASNNVIGFFDDDIVLENGCIENLWRGLQENPNCGGINAVITNQYYHPLGKVSRLFYNLLGINTSKSLAGKCVGPAINFLPQLENTKDFIDVDWLNTTCTLYRKQALPNPVFDNHFTGYSLMEDLALSLRVGKNWKLLTASNSRIYHDSQPSEGKNNILINAEMDLVNRFYIMKHILNKNSFKDYLRLFIQQLFVGMASKNIFHLSYMRGKINGLKKLKRI